MTTATNQFRPDYAVPPGWVLEERLGVQEISHAEFARRCGRSPKLISEIIAGKASIEPETALQFEKVLGVDASIWLGIEKDYQLYRARETETADAGSWVKGFPVKELVKRGAIRCPETDADTVSELLAFFRVGSVSAWKLKYGLANVAYRQSPSFQSEEAALATWLRLGEIEAEEQECADYSESRFKKALREIRTLTRLPVDQALQRSRQLCNQAGVVLSLVRPLPKTALSGAAWWQSPRKAVIQLSARHKSDDHLWFSFFHEAAHILLHSKKNIFIDGMSDGQTEIEREANEWAANILVPKKEFERFISECPRSKKDIVEFSNKQAVAPGIVVGMLQHKGILPWSHMNGLKVRLTWKEDS